MLPVGGNHNQHVPQEEGRVLFLYDGEFAIDNGVSHYIRTVGDYLTQEGCQVDYLVGQDSTGEADVSAFSRTAGIHANGSTSVIPTHTPRHRIVDFLGRTRPDAVHVQMPFLPTLAGKVIQELDPQVRLIGTFHTPPPSGWLGIANRLNARLTRAELGRFDHFYSVSEVARQTANEFYGVDPEILPCPVDISHREGSEPADGSDGRTTLTFLGRLVARKGLSDLVEGFAMLEPRVRDQATLQVIGEGRQRTAVEKRIRDHGLQDKVRLLGRVEENDKRRLLANSDIVVCPSTSDETFGIALAETMAVGKPIVIASDVAGYAELLRGVPEALFPKNNPSALAERLQTILARPALRSAIFAGQQALVERLAVNGSVGRQLIKAYGISPDSPGGAAT